MLGDQLKVAKINDAASKSSDLKLWHYALLIGIPSAALLSFILYKKYYHGDKSNNKDVTLNKNAKKEAIKINDPVASSTSKQAEQPKTKDIPIKNQKPKVN